VGAIAVFVALSTVPPVNKLELVGRWSCNCNLCLGNSAAVLPDSRHLSFDLKHDGVYSLARRDIVRGTAEGYAGPGWDLESIQPVRGRYFLSFGPFEGWMVRFARDHRTIYVNDGAEKRVLVKVDD
jgi:hypothetical protein